jgi:hypothetical protein
VPPPVTRIVLPVICIVLPFRRCLYLHTRGTVPPHQDR